MINIYALWHVMLNLLVLA